MSATGLPEKGGKKEGKREGRAARTAGRRQEERGIPAPLEGEKEGGSTTTSIISTLPSFCPYQLRRGEGERGEKRFSSLAVSRGRRKKKKKSSELGSARSSCFPEDEKGEEGGGGVQESGEIILSAAPGQWRR